jgi:AraC-like DNA-binding protein
MPTPDHVLRQAVRAAQRGLRRGSRLLAIRAAGRPQGDGTGQLFSEAKILLIRDQGWTVNWGQRQECLQAPDILLVAPGTTHREQSPGPGPTEVVNIFTSGDNLIVGAATVHPPFEVQVHLEELLSAAGGVLIRHLVILLAEERHPPAILAQARHLLLDLLAEVSESSLRQPVRGGDFVATACRHLIDDHHADPACTVASLAATLGLHPGSLSRTFRRATGGTVAGALAARRIQAAQHLLVEQRLPIAEIARRCGFTRRDVFTRAFRAATGHAPVDWRRFGFVEEDVLRRR